MDDTTKPLPPHVKIVSDGTSIGTHIYIDGKPIAARAVEFSVSAANPEMLAVAKITMAVHEVEIAGHAHVVLD